ncbi:hypothetical protein FM113_02125 [Leucobacter sp. 7(1)]|uniref:hypothetical protein n=1 Tax=Leucobacter sp. 7(1) TaxID=1255613 RepID=UPI00097E7E59|nr:hypothetical protein [Leucobacter sp. 7(1)]SJN08334.1 hypothetical protein FM113_02125 [Leucobacter sp. 7(1)]
MRAPVTSSRNTFALECNSLPTNGVILLEAEDFSRALTGDDTEPVLVLPWRRTPGHPCSRRRGHIHVAKLSHGTRTELLVALGDDIVWNGEPIPGMTPEDREALTAVHVQRA